MTELTEREVEVLHEALDDEYRAWATYDQVIADFSEVRPFIKIREFEARHIDALCRLFERHAVPIPENPCAGKVERYESVREACEAGVAAEIANGEMYERLLQATRRPEIVDVLRNLQEASQERHLPAFQRGAQRSGEGRGEGRGGGQRRRHRDRL